MSDICTCGHLRDYHNEFSTPGCYILGCNCKKFSEVKEAAENQSIADTKAMIDRCMRLIDGIDQYLPSIMERNGLSSEDRYVYSICITNHLTDLKRIFTSIKGS